MKARRLGLVLTTLGIMILFSHCAMAKKPVLKNTTWTAIQEIFVADAGTMTITHSLVFGPANDVRIVEKTVMPSYPAMYVNPDGSIDTIQGWSNEQEKAGKYTFGKDKLTVILDEDGKSVEFLWKNGAFTREELGEELTYSLREE